MKNALVALICSAVVGLVALPPPALAQQKTVKVCRDEWQANKAANQAAGITQKAYVDKCRGGSAAAEPAATPSATPTASSTSGQKTVKACRGEWSANKDAYQAGGITQKTYVDKCRAGETVALPSGTSPAAANPPPATAPAAAPATTTAAAPQKTVKACRDEWGANKAAYQAGGVTQKAYVDKCRAGETVALPSGGTSSTAANPPPAAAPAPTAAPVAVPPAKPGRTAATTPTGADQFTTEAQAKGHCPADTVVWANTDSKVYHFSGNKRYGNTKQGAYMCEKDAGTQGFRAAKNEKRT